ncbi:MAG: purine-binding chemotaxis protein CheW [Symploca sp. SIO1B1]|nr:purine-binding chemotaxis protein CheW [Symploca sp. SIO2D2]NEQ64593.1 purine-binding chemotaxis protein CheW [Symploca sp. SIO2D2]NER24775.1 purine-binding chemotaxis protein CheW [Symploca sp. SIO1C2]NER46113.1 purine-binding chemotaxis protein CheW [Symploca sp. SIO1A3]NER96307.1 purine-binding chemotaxis protein CheW [Symploca sp. SIO1B1]
MIDPSASKNALALVPTQPLETKNQGDTYLKFQLARQTPAVLSMIQAQEVIVLAPSRLTPMPNMPPYVMGLLNRRSRVLWVIDLSRMLGLPGVETNVQQYSIVIIGNESATLGLIVVAVEGVLRLTSECIQSPIEQLSSSIVPYLRGCILQEQEILLLLDAEAIMRNAQQ